MRYENFTVDNLFSLSAIKQAKSQNNIPTDNDGIPYIVQSTKNNMCSRKVNRQWLEDNNEPPVDGNCIVLGVTLPAVSYQPYTFGASQVIVARADFLNEEIGLYMAAMFEKQMYKFSYSSKPSFAAYKAMSFSLPIKTDKNNNPVIDNECKYHDEGFIPDFDYMQERIEELEQERIEELEQYLAATGLNDYELTDDDLSIYNTFKETKSFKLSELFIIEGTKSLDAGKLTFEKDGINFIGRSFENNGIQGKIKKQSFEPNDANTITATVIGNYKYVKLQEEPYYCSQNINKLTPKQSDVSPKALYYIITYIQKFVSRWDGQQGGYKLDDIRNHSISLPVTSSGVPDYDYMEKYIRVQEKLVIKNFIEHKDYIIYKTKEIVEGV